MSLRYEPRIHPMLAGESAMKSWCLEEAYRTGITLSAVYTRLSRGHYKNLQFRHVNKRVVFVKENPEANG